MIATIETWVGVQVVNAESSCKTGNEVCGLQQVQQSVQVSETNMAWEKLRCLTIYSNMAARVTFARP